MLTGIRCTLSEILPNMVSQIGHTRTHVSYFLLTTTVIHSDGTGISFLVLADRLRLGGCANHLRATKPDFNDNPKLLPPIIN